MLSYYTFDTIFGEGPFLSFEMKSYINLNSAFWQKIRQNFIFLNIVIVIFVCYNKLNDWDSEKII